MILRKKNLLYYSRKETPSDGYRLLYLQNGNDSSNSKLHNWSINTGIRWKHYFYDNPSSSSPTLKAVGNGLECVITYCYLYIPPEGGLIAGCNDPSWGGDWRIFGYSGGNFCFDIFSDTSSDRVNLGYNMTAGQVYTETVRASIRSDNQASMYIKVEGLGEKTQTSYYSFGVMHIDNLLYLFYDIDHSGDVSARGGLQIYGFTVYTTLDDVRVSKIYEGVPWMDPENIPCFKDLVSGELQYNCASDPQPFLYGEI